VTLVADRAPLTLQVYRLLTAVSAPIADMVLNRRLKRGRELAARLPERRGEAPSHVPKVLWYGCMAPASAKCCRSCR
jgi:hypothetical protein